MKPEEIVRQLLVCDMIGRFGFPRELVAIEKEIATLPHLQGRTLPKRRLDVICFAKLKETLYPLLLVECKAVPLSQKTLEQVFGYNYYVEASFIAIANGDGLIMMDRIGERVIHGLLPYAELVAHAMDSREKSLSSF